MNAIEVILLFYQLALKKAKSYADKLFGKVPTGGLFWRGAVNYYADLPTNAEVGDCYTVKYLGDSGTDVGGIEYAWGKLDGKLQWIPLGPDIDIRLYVKRRMPIKPIRQREIILRPFHGQPLTRWVVSQQQRKPQSPWKLPLIQRPDGYMSRT